MTTLKGSFEDIFSEKTHRVFVLMPPKSEFQLNNALGHLDMTATTLWKTPVQSSNGIEAKIKFTNLDTGLKNQKGLGNT